MATVSLLAGVNQYRGVYSDGTTYQTGDVVDNGGGLTSA